MFRYGNSRFIRKKKELHNLNGNRPKISLIDEDFSLELEKIVFDLGLLESGHYYLKNDKHSKDWIDTITLLESHIHLNQITSKFEEYLKEIFNDENIFIIGIGFPGVLLSSALGNKMGVPFSYLIPKNEQDLHVEMEIRIEDIPNIPIVLITDVIVYGSTLNDLIDTINQKHNFDCTRIKSFLSVFYRFPFNDYKSIQLDSLKGIAVLNNTMDIEICQKNIQKCNLKSKSLVNLRFAPSK